MVFTCDVCVMVNEDIHQFSLPCSCALALCVGCAQQCKNKCPFCRGVLLNTVVLLLPGDTHRGGPLRLPRPAKRFEVDENGLLFRLEY
jgi:hypothetical protein